jgi:hypothetical protein
MRQDKTEFPKRSIRITMLGEEWFALAVKLAGHELSDEGMAHLRIAVAKITAQLQVEAVT